MSDSEPPEPVSLEALRADDPDAWERASLELWRIVRCKTKGVIPHATESELEELAAPVVAKIASQIIDPTQEAFVKAMSFSDFLNLTARIAHGKAVDLIRKSAVRSSEENVEHIKNLFSTPQTPTDSAMVKERKIRIHAAIGDLPEKDRVIIEDFYFSKLGTREIAKKLGLSNGAVCARLSAARNRLGDLIQSHGIGREDLQ